MVAAVAVMGVAALIALLVTGGSSRGRRQVGAGSTTTTTVPAPSTTPPTTAAPPTTWSGPLPAAVIPHAVKGNGNGPAPPKPTALPDLGPWHQAIEAQDAGFFARTMGIDPNALAAVPGKWYKLETDVVGGSVGTVSPSEPESTNVTVTIDAVANGNADVVLHAAESGFLALGWMSPAVQNTGNPLTREVDLHRDHAPAGLEAYESVDVTVTDRQNGTSQLEVELSPSMPGNVPPTATGYAVIKAIALGGGSYNFAEGSITYTDGALAQSLGLSSPRDTEAEFDWRQEAPATANRTVAGQGMRAVLCKLPSVSCEPGNQQLAPDVEYDASVQGQSDAAMVTAESNTFDNPPKVDIEAQLTEYLNVA